MQRIGDGRSIFSRSSPRRCRRTASASSATSSPHLTTSSACILTSLARDKRNRRAIRRCRWNTTTTWAMSRLAVGPTSSATWRTGRCYPTSSGRSRGRRRRRACTISIVAVVTQSCTRRSCQCARRHSSSEWRATGGVRASSGAPSSEHAGSGTHRNWARFARNTLRVHRNCGHFMATALTERCPREWDALQGSCFIARSRPSGSRSESTQSLCRNCIPERVNWPWFPSTTAPLLLRKIRNPRFISTKNT